MYKFIKSSTAMVAFATLGLISNSVAAQAITTLPGYPTGANFQPMVNPQMVSPKMVNQQQAFRFANPNQVAAPARAGFPTQPQAAARQALDVTPNPGSSYSYNASQNLAAVSQMMVDPNDNRTDTVTYSPYTGRAHGNIFYTAPITRQLVDDRQHIRSTSADFQQKFANRRSGARQLDAQNRRSGYRILGGGTPAAATAAMASQQQVRIVRYAVPVRVPVTINAQQARQNFVQQLQTQQVPVQQLQIRQVPQQVRFVQQQPAVTQYYTTQTQPVQYTTSYQQVMPTATTSSRIFTLPAGQVSGTQFQTGLPGQITLR